MKNRPAVIASIVGVVMVALIAVFIVSSGKDGNTDTNQLIGRPVPTLEGTDSRGRMFRQSDYLGQFVVVNFFATWCPPCRVEHPELVSFSNKHAAIGDASVVAIAYDEPAETVNTFFDKEGGDWPVLTGLGSEVNVEFAVIKLPESYLVSPEGIVIKKFVGGLTAAAIEEAMAAWEPTPTTVASSGDGTGAEAGN